MSNSIDWEDYGFGRGTVSSGPSPDSVARPWEDAAVFGINKEPPHAHLVPLCDSGSPLFRTLNGAWRFLLVDGPGQIPAGFESPDYDDSAWSEIAVPGHWQLQGHGNPIYTNIEYPFPANPPRVPAANPTGLHRTRFDLPEAWWGRPVFITFEGVDSCLELWLNGQWIGYSQVSRCPAEFNLTHCLKEGQNVLCARVLQWCDGTYLEDQDMWWLSGIFRDAWIRSEDHLQVRDLILSPVCSGRAGEIGLQLHCRNLSTHPVQGTAIVTVLDPDGAAACETTKLTLSLAALAEEPFEACLLVESPTLWSAEDPALYTVIVEISTDGAKRDYRQRCGFRSVLIENGCLLINDRPVKLRGVNRHEFHPDRGRTVTEGDMVRDIALIKRHNFNAVRTSHYPNHPRWLELCDEYGLYVIAEADLETHGLRDKLTHDSVWREAYLDRADRLVRRDRNHPSVIAWSVGNESGSGVNIEAMVARVRQLDSTRPVNYHHAGTEPYVDWVTMHYPTLLDMRKILECEGCAGRPILLEEYGHAAGNGLGNLREYWRLIESEPRLIGGFIWEWCDQALRKSGADEAPAYAYGGDFGDQPNDGHWCVDGIVFPDRCLKPAVLEAKRVQQPVELRLERSSPARLLVRNKRSHRDLTDLACAWSVQADGIEVARGEAVLPRIGPGDWGAVTLSPDAVAVREGNECLLTISLVLKEGTVWADSGYEVAWEQFQLRTTPVRAQTPPGPVNQPLLHATSDLVMMRSGASVFEIDRNSGNLVRLQKGDCSWPISGPDLSVWRAPLDNDRPFVERWREAGLHTLNMSDCSSDLDDRPGMCTVHFSRYWRNRSDEILFEERISYSLLPTGALQLVQTVLPEDEDLPSLPRIGLRLHLPKALDCARWYGRGPQECLCDRKWGAKIGLYQATAEELAVPYIYPQENGMRCDVRWLELLASGNSALRFSASDHFIFSLRRHSVEQIEAAAHQEDLTDSEDMELCIDYRQSGTGNTSLWAERLTEYQVPARSYSWLIDLALT